MRRYAFLVLSVLLLAAPAGGKTLEPAKSPRVPASSYGAFHALPLMLHSLKPGIVQPQTAILFERNVGQMGEEVKFFARGPGYLLYLTASEAVIELPCRVSGTSESAAFGERMCEGEKERSVLRLKFSRTCAPVVIEGINELPGKSNYLIGTDPAKWHKRIPNFARVLYHELYPGIDLVFYSNRAGQLEFDVIAAPGADYRQVQLDFEGAASVAADIDGSLRITMPDGRAIVQQRPSVRQDIDGEVRAVDGFYVQRGTTNSFSIGVGPYDASRPLVIDPVIIYSTFLGADAWDDIRDIAVDAGGNLYATGAASPARFPTTGGSFQVEGPGSSNAFVAKYDRSGQAIYITYLGGSDQDNAYGIAIDSDSSAYVVGDTSSTDFPLRNAFQTTRVSAPDAFITKMNESGSDIIYSSYLGGNRRDSALDIVLDPNKKAYIVGETWSNDFPVTSDALYGTPFNWIDHTLNTSDIFVATVGATGNKIYATYYGGGKTDRALGAALDSEGSLYVTGYTFSGSTSATTAGSRPFPTTSNCIKCTYSGLSYDAVVFKLSAANQVVYSTYLGGNKEDQGRSIAVDGNKSAYVVGFTASEDFPTASALQSAYGGGLGDAFVSKLTPNGSGLAYSTYLGGNDTDYAKSIVLDNDANSYIAGQTQSPDFPFFRQIQDASTPPDAIVVKLNPSGSQMLFSTPYGGSRQENIEGCAIAVDRTGSIYIAGGTYSQDDFPVQNPYQNTSGGSYEGWAAKLGEIFIYLR